MTNGYKIKVKRIDPINGYWNLEIETWNIISEKFINFINLSPKKDIPKRRIMDNIGENIPIDVFVRVIIL